MDTLPEDRTNYDTLKTKILAAIGDTPERAADYWWTIKGSTGESPDALVSHIAPINHRQLSNCKSFEEVISLITLHNDVNNLGDPIQRLVVPIIGRRKKLLEIGHGKLTAWHFGRKKTSARLARYFTWPGIYRDIQQLCRIVMSAKRQGHTQY